MWPGNGDEGSGRMRTRRGCRARGSGRRRGGARPRRPSRAPRAGLPEVRLRRGVVHGEAARREQHGQVEELVQVTLRRERHRHDGDGSGGGGVLHCFARSRRGG